MRTNKLFFSLMVITMAANTTAQTVTNRFEFGDANRKAFSIPKEFSYNNIPYLIMYEDDRNIIKIYDENLDMVKQITMKESIPFNYQLTYQDETREVTAVNEVRRNVNCEYSSYDEFIQHEKNLTPGFDESWLIITNLSDGTRKISIDYSKVNNYPYYDNNPMYFAYDYFGMKYPKFYLIDSSEKVVGYRVEYNATYSDWKITGNRTVDCNVDQKHIKLCNINLNNGEGKADSYFEVSQTLFNKDASFEYIMPIYKLATKGNVNGYYDYVGPEDPERIITTRSTVISEQKELALAGFQLVSENGNVTSNIVFDGGFEGSIYLDCAFVITIGSNTYLAFDGYCNNENSTIFYKIDNSTNSIQKVKIAPSRMSVSPTVVNKGSIINVNFNDRNENGSDIIMTSATGAISQKLNIPAGQTSATIQTNANNGMYCVSRVQKGKVQETKKIIIK